MSGGSCGDLVDTDEVARRLGVQRATVHVWRTRSQHPVERVPMPAPNHVFGGVPVWHWGTIEAWAVATGRLDVADVG